MDRRQFFGLGPADEPSSVFIGHGPVVFPTTTADSDSFGSFATSTAVDDGDMFPATTTSIPRFPTLQSSSSTRAFGFPFPVAATTSSSARRRTTTSSTLRRTFSTPVTSSPSASSAFAFETSASSIVASETLAFETPDSTTLAAGVAQSGEAGATPLPSAQGSGSKAWIAAAVIVPLAALILLALAVLFFLRRHKQRQQQRQRSQQHTRSSTGSTGLFHTGRSSAVSDMEKFGAKSSGGPELTKPAASVTHNYLSGVDISSPSSLADDIKFGSAEQSLRPMASFAATNSRTTSAGGVTPMTTRSNPFTDASLGSSRGAFSFSGFSGGAGDSGSSAVGGGAPRDLHAHNHPPPQPSTDREPVSPIGPDSHADALDDDAFSIISEAEVHQGEVARKQRASVVMMGGSGSGLSNERRPS